MSANHSNSLRLAPAIDATSVRSGSNPPTIENSNPPISTSPEAHKQSPIVPPPATSSGVGLLNAMWPSPDRCHQLGTLDKETGKFKSVPVTGVDDAVAQALKLSSAGRDVYYFACAEYLTLNNRTAVNASGAYGIWMDIDCGEEKAAAGKGYPTVDDATEALGQFRKEAGLPKPTHIVSSGGGLHVYWVVNKVVHRDAWQAHARMLKAVTKACGFLTDDSRTADIASVLRVPVTVNHKFFPPRPVSLIHVSAEFIDTSVMLDAIATAHDRLCGAPAPTTNRDPSAATATASTHAYGSPDLARLASALATLDPDCDEEIWKLRRLAPLALAAHDNPDLSLALYELTRSWSSGDLRGKPSIAWVTPGGNGLTGEEAFDPTWDRFLNGSYTGVPVTIGTIFHDAKQAGWEPDDSFEVIDDGEDE